MKELVKEILQWQHETFPRATMSAVEDKLIAETRELEESLLVLDALAVADEIADVFIVGCRYLDMCGINIEAAIRKKMEINRGREFGPELPNGDRKRVK